MYLALLEVKIYIYIYELEAAEVGVKITSYRGVSEICKFVAFHNEIPKRYAQMNLSRVRTHG